MGYRKGFIDISRDRDVPLLQQVLSCQVVSRSQLLSFMRLRRFESSRQAFNWRVRRLAEHELLFVHQVPSISRDDLIALSPQGIACLEAHGEFSAAAFTCFPPAICFLPWLATFEEASGDSGSDWSRNSNPRCLKRRSPMPEGSNHFHYGRCFHVAERVSGYVSAAFRFGSGCFFRCSRCPRGSTDYDLSAPYLPPLLTPINYLA
jgi:hypothetical protein